jgi:pyridoxamine 5'-phosphate oxidase family protein
MSLTFTPTELEYLHVQRIGRLATVDAEGAPQNNPVGFAVDEAGRVLVGGLDLAGTRKFRNVRRHPSVAFVVDDLASDDPWVVRGVEVRGPAEALDDVDPPLRGMSRAVIRITPRWIATWGLEPGGMRVRRAPLTDAGALRS